MENTKKKSVYKKEILYHDVRKIQRKLFIKTTLQLFLCDLNLNFINFFAFIFFSRAKKRTKMLMFTNNLLTKKICAQQRLRKKWKYLENKLIKNPSQ